MKLNRLQTVIIIMRDHGAHMGRISVDGIIDAFKKEGIGEYADPVKIDRALKALNRKGLVEFGKPN